MRPPSLTACSLHAITAEPEALRTSNLQTQPRKPLHAVDACHRHLSLLADPLLPVPHHSNALPVSSCAHVVRPGALTTDSWVLSHEAGGHQNLCFRRHRRRTTFPLGGTWRDLVPDGDDSTAFSGGFCPRGTSPPLSHLGIRWRGNDKHPCWQCVHTERASVGCAQPYGVLSLCPRELVEGGMMTALAYNGIFVPHRSLEVSDPTLLFAFGIGATGGR